MIGCGFAGLAAAIAFRQGGHDVTVFERSDGIVESSAAISLAPNALRCLDILGVRDQFPSSSMARLPATIRSDTGRVLMRSSLARFAGGDDYCLAERSMLLKSLLAQVPHASVRFRSNVTEVRPTGEVHADGVQHRFDLVVAADGAHSRARRTLWPHEATPHRTGITAWTWIVNQQMNDGYGAIWGRFAEFGILPLPDGRTYVWGGARPGHADLSAYRDWPLSLPELIAAADSDRISTVELTEVAPPRNFPKGRVVLIGDSAHAMRPTLGQGAALAMEDAITLAHGGIEQLARRRPRMLALYWVSKTGSRVAIPKLRILAAARNTALRLAPDRVMASSVGSVSRWTAPPRSS